MTFKNTDFNFQDFQWDKKCVEYVAHIMIGFLKKIHSKKLEVPLKNLHCLFY